jgi:hypothetical protein
MQTITNATIKPEGSSHIKPFIIRKRIGNIVYEVEVHFNPDAKETMQDKIKRLIEYFSFLFIETTPNMYDCALVQSLG